MEPLQIVAATPPVQATLRILLNSVPYLIGCAVVRQPAGPDAVAAEVGRNPWLFDRRLTTLELPDDALPANRAVALDWPVPYQAEWVGVPPRLLISRLVFAERTVGVLLGTLITREQLSAQAREAIDLSCELIASAMAMHAAAAFAPLVAARMEPAPAAEPAPKPRAAEPAAPAGPRATDSDPRTARVADTIRTAVEAASDARAIGRILRDAMNEISEASAFAVALFHADRPEVAYRYKVVGVDAASSELGRQAVDDSPSCYAVRSATTWHAFDRSVTVAGERRRVSVLQLPLTERAEAIGVVTLQTFREGGFAAGELELVVATVAATVAGFSRVRAEGRFQPGSAPALTLSKEAPRATAAAPQAPEPVGAPAASTEQSATDEILHGLLDACALGGVPTAFVVGLDPAAGLLRGDRVSGASEAAELDAVLGISSGRFAVSIDDRYNAIARACREARMVSTPTVHELVQPAAEWSDALIVERLVHGGRSTVIPIVVSGDVVGALIAGPRFDELDPPTLEHLGELVADAGRRLAIAWRAASLGAVPAADPPVARAAVQVA